MLGPSSDREKSDVPHFEDLTICFDSEETLLEGAFNLVERVRKDWNRADFKTKPFKVSKTD